MLMMAVPTRAATGTLSLDISAATTCTIPPTISTTLISLVACNICRRSINTFVVLI